MPNLDEKPIEQNLNKNKRRGMKARDIRLGPLFSHKRTNGSRLS